MVDELGQRADDVQRRLVDRKVDNMLKITMDGRKVGLDPRLVSPTFEDNPESKVNICVKNVVNIHKQTAPQRLTQLVFCDLGTPKDTPKSDAAKETEDGDLLMDDNGNFNLYDDIRNKLIANGVPKHEIAFIHDANTEDKKIELFNKVRKGEVRVLIGSTAKMGAGTNVQDLLIASHDLDAPYRPSDMERAPVKAILMNLPLAR